MNRDLKLKIRDSSCEACRLFMQADGEDRCVTGRGDDQPDVVVVGKFPFSQRGLREMREYFQEAGIPDVPMIWTSALKCRVYDMSPSKTDQKACKPYLQAELEYLKPKAILVLGNEALFAVLGNSGVMNHRGKVADHECGAKVFVTISPSMVARQPGFRKGFVADLRYFSRLLKGTEVSEDPHHVPGDHRRTQVMDKETLRRMLSHLKRAGAVSYDVENTRGSPYESDAAIVSLSVTATERVTMEDAHVWELPLFHPESPWRNQWQMVLKVIGKHLPNVPKRVAHNGKHDDKWLSYFGCPVRQTFDTILAIAVTDENGPKGLKPNAQQRLGADPWGIDTKDLLSTPLKEVLEYNGLDTWHDLRLYLLLREDLRKYPRQARLFSKLLMPAVNEFVDVELKGIWVDKPLMLKNARVVRTKLKAIRKKLMEWVPEEEEIPEKFWKKGELQVNFNASNFARWLLFDHLQLPILKRGKEKDNGSPGDPSMAEGVLMVLAKLHEIAEVLIDRIEWNKMDTGFFNPYIKQLDKHDRLHSTFKPWATVTGRLSSGKEDAEKVQVKKGKAFGINLQQVPRNPLVRGIFGAPPGWYFVEADYSQVELRVAAFLSREDNMLSLYARGQDIHMAMAMRMTGKPASQIAKEERKRAKAVNFGFLYGMGVKKFLETALLNYGLTLSEEEGRAARKTYFAEFPKLIPWHNRQRRLAHKFGRVQTPMGRVRHLPDIYSPNPGVQAEAERQAINSPVQGFASDMALLSFVMISQELKRRGYRAFSVGTVHDAVNFEVHEDDLEYVLPLIKDTMENLPLEKDFGVILDVPIIADLKIGRHWGGATELTPEQIYNRDKLEEVLEAIDETN